MAHSVLHKYDHKLKSRLATPDGFFFAVVGTKIVVVIAGGSNNALQQFREEEQSYPGQSSSLSLCLYISCLAIHRHSSG